MKTISVALMSLLGATVAFAASTITTVVLVDAQSKELAKKYVQDSACIRIYEIETKNSGFLDTHIEGVAQVMTLRSKADATKYYKIYSDERSNKGYGLMEVGAFSLPKCTDYELL